jgi:copper chaperone CopZ
MFPHFASGTRTLERSIVVPTFESPHAPSPPSPPPDAPRPVGARIAFILVVAGLVAVIGFVTWRGTLRARDNAPAAAAEGGVITLAVDGMSCVGCAGAVETSLEDVPGVAEATVDYEHRLARIRLADQNVAPSTLVAAIEEAGYKAHVER